MVVIMKKVIINADDFGLHELVNNAIEKAHQNGVLSSATLLACGEAFESAVSIAQKNVSLGVGVHLCLVGGLHPVSDACSVPSLLDPNTGKFYDNYLLFTKKYFSGAVNVKEIALELEAQVLKIKNSDVDITHIDSHQHLHMLPGITEIAVDICKKYGLTKSRASKEGVFFTGGYPYSYGRYVGKIALTCMSMRAKYYLSKKEIKCPEYFYGMLAGGNMRKEYLLQILSCLPHGVSEIMVHPGLDEKFLSEYFGFEYNWQKEYEALISAEVKSMMIDSGIELISFKDL